MPTSNERDRKRKAKKLTGHAMIYVTGIREIDEGNGFLLGAKFYP